MTRARWFCAICGALTNRPPDDGRYARCAAHSTLPLDRDLIPPDPATNLPTMAASQIREAAEPPVTASRLRAEARRIEDEEAAVDLNREAMQAPRGTEA